MALRLATLVPKDRAAIIFGRHRGQLTAGLTPGTSRSFSCHTRMLTLRCQIIWGGEWLLCFASPSKGLRGATARGPRYIHSPESWKTLWEGVFRDTHQQVAVAAELVNERQMVWSVHISPK